MCEIKRIIGNNLKFIRYQSGLSQEKFYSEHGLSPKYLASIERGEINIGVELLFELAHTLKTTPSELVTYDPSKIVTKKRVDQKQEQ